MRISVVVVSLNGERRIGACLDALRRTEWPDLEVIVLDNGSRDATSRVVRASYPEVRLLRSPRNLGFAGGNNLAAAHATGEWIILLNDDTEPEPGWITELMDAGRRLPRAGILGCLLLYPDGKTIQHAGGVVHANGLTDHLEWGATLEGDVSERPPRRCDYVTGAAMAIRREAWERVGPLDPGYFPIYYEENELCCRAREAGWEVWVIPRARVIHAESQTQGRWSRMFLVRYHRNRLRFLRRNRRGRELLRAMKAEWRWLIGNRPYDQVGPLAQAYAQALLGWLTGR
jgi:GT2 family glycosyltransferase